MNYCLIGKIVGVKGIRGEVKVFSYSDIPGRFGLLGKVLIGTSEAETLEFHVDKAQESHGKVYLFFRDIADRSGAEMLVGQNIYIPDSEMMSPPEGRYYVHDLVGCRVLTPAGKDKGQIVDVMLLPANDVYVVLCENKEVLVPAIPAYIKNVDIKSKCVVIEDVQGLFEDEDEN